MEESVAPGSTWVSQPGGGVGDNHERGGEMEQETTAVEGLPKRKVKAVRCYILGEAEDQWVANTCLHSPDPRYMPAVAIEEDQVEQLLEVLEAADRIELLRDELSSNYARVRDQQATAESRIIAQRNVQEIRATIRTTRSRLRDSIGVLKGVLQVAS